MMQDTMVGKKFGNLVVQKLAYRGMPVWLWQSLSCPGIPSEKRSYEELWLSAKKKDDEPLAGSYRAEVRETCGPAAGESR